MPTLVPDYLSVDFTTIIARIKSQLEDSDVFQDYNYEGSNFAVLLELLAYIGELNVYMINKLAKNVHIETADIYEAVNRNARMMGYEPKGPVSSRGTVTVSVTGSTPNNEFIITPFKQLECPTELDADGSSIKFANTTSYTTTPTAAAWTVDMTVKQGEVTQLTGYKGRDLIDNELLLPANYAYDNDVSDDYPSLEVTIGTDAWTRVSDFYDDLSALQTVDDVYMFIYDRYQRSKLVFNTARNIPAADDDIALTVLKTLGSDGNVAAATITQFPTQFVYDNTGSAWVDVSDITLTNADATTGGADAEAISTIKDTAQGQLRAQFRNLTASDYRAHLESRSDVVQANAWGEQDLTPSGAVQEFNRVHLSVIPDAWSPNTIGYTSSIWTTSWNTSGNRMVPSAYHPDYETNLKSHTEARKMISAFEEYDLPNLIYFSFDFGVRKKRTFDMDEISTDLKNKLIYYFRSANQDFGSTINFNDIHEYLMDTTEVSTTDNFTNVKGIRNLNIRDIDVHVTVNEPNTTGNYPQYIEQSSDYIGENQLRKIKLGPNQFPILLSTTVSISEET
jgi:hypothetical protein